MRYKLFGKSGLRVSEICLGTMTFGTEWTLGADYVTSKSVFEAYTNAGGNFIDTANRYTEGTSERWLGEFIASDRDHFVLATKYSLQDRMNDPSFSGNHRKNLMRSVRQSLERLNTDHIDILWLHMWDFTTPVEEVMRGLDDLISRGIVHYIGISDTPAWIISQANTLAELRGWSAFTGLQIEYSLIQRTPERDLLPMAKALGLAAMPWGTLAGGALTGKYLKGEQGRVPEHSIRRNERSTVIAKEVVAISEETGIPASQIPIAWARNRDQLIIPIIGAKRAEQLHDSLGALSVRLTDEHMERLNNVSAIELGFPHDFLVTDGVKNVIGNTQDLIDGLRR